MTEFDYIGQNKAEDACENGIKIGEVPISRETKGSWSQQPRPKGRSLKELIALCPNL